MRLGKFVAIEGIDGTGKGTQHKLLLDRLKENKISIAPVDFPQYETSLFGNLIGKTLNGEFGDFNKIPPEIISVVYAADRYKASNFIRSKLNQGISVVANRYTLSNAHQASRLEKNKQNDFIKWLYQMEYGTEGFNIPKPDLYIHLDIPVNISQQLILKKAGRKYLNGQKKDVIEDDQDNQTNTASIFRMISKTQPGIVSIDCAQNGKLLSIEKVHNLVWNQVKLLFDF